MAIQINKRRMMGLFDYLFYRVHIHYQKHGEYDLWGPSIFVGACMVLLSLPIWYGAYQILFGEEHYRICIVIVCIIAYVWTYLRYKKRKERIIMKYANSKYNRRIPIFLIYSMTIVFFIIAVVCISLLKHFILEPYHLEGILVT